MQVLLSLLMTSFIVIQFDSDYNSRRDNILLTLEKIEHKGNILHSVIHLLVK